MDRTQNLKKINLALFILLVAAFISSCGQKKSDIRVSSINEAGPATSGSGVNISGKLTLDSLGLNTPNFNLLDSSKILKATYANEPEDAGAISADGSYNIRVKALPFALTVFVDEVPSCSFIFNVGGKKIGSILAATDLALGQTSCVDGQAVIEEKYLSGKIDQAFNDKVGKGEIADEIKSKFLDPFGLSVTILASNGAPQSGTSEQEIGLQDGQSALTGTSDTETSSASLDPKICAASGYEVPDYFFQDYQNSLDATQKASSATPTIFVEESAIGVYRLRVESKGRDGQPQVDVFENINLGGSGEEFALVGAAPISGSDLKAKAAVGTLRDILYTLNTGNEAPPMPTWSDWSCDPLQIVNAIAASVGHQAYTNASVFQAAVKSSVAKPQYTVKSSSKPLCTSAGTGGLSTLKKLCFEADGTTAKTHTLMAAKMICQVAREAGKINYRDITLKEANGDPAKACIKETNNKLGTKYRIKFLSISEGECNSFRQASLATPPSDGSTLTYTWRMVARNMNLDCSELRVAQIPLKECQFNYDYTVEPNYIIPSPEELPPPANWWDGKYALADAAVAIDTALAKKNRGTTISPLAAVKDKIESCSAGFSRSLTELNRRRAKINGIAAAINLIATTKDTKGKLKYLDETTGNFVTQGNFSFTSTQISSMQDLLKKAQASLDAWAGSVKQIQDTYTLLQNAALKAEVDDPNKCLAAEVGTSDAFTSVYTNFDKALFGRSGDKVNRGIKNWQDAAFNHFRCMEMDQNLLRVRNFGISAPDFGIVDSNTSATAGSNLVLDESSTCDFTDYRGRCIKTIACQIPAGAETYVRFNSLYEKGTIEDGCDSVVQKVAMMGRINAHAFKVNTIDVPPNELIGSMLLMTSLPKRACTLTLKIPAMDKDGCFVYQNESGVSWGELSTEERNAAVPSDFSLITDDKKIPMLNIANRQILQILLTPNSEVPTLKQQKTGTIKADTNSSEIDKLIQPSK